MQLFEPDISETIDLFWNQNIFMASVDLRELIEYKKFAKNDSLKFLENFIFD